MESKHLTPSLFVFSTRRARFLAPSGHLSGVPSTLYRSLWRYFFSTTVQSRRVYFTDGQSFLTFFHLSTEIFHVLVIHSNREIPLLGIKRLYKQIYQNKTLTRLWSLGGLFSVWAANDRNSHWSRGLIMISNVKPTSRLWYSEQSRATSKATLKQMRLASLFLVFTFTDCSDTSSCYSGIMHCTVSSRPIWPDQTSW